MVNIKNSLLDFLKFNDFTLKSIACARAIVHNIGVIDLKVNYTDEELNNFLHELDFDVVHLDLEVIRAYIWMDNGGWYRCRVIDMELVAEYAGRTYYNYVCEPIMFDEVVKIELPLS